MSVTKERRALEKYFTVHKPATLPFGKELEGVVVIPVLADFMVFKALESLKAAIDVSKRRVEVVVVINHPAGAEESIKKKNAALAKRLKEVKAGFPLHIIYLADIDKKIAGVGSARKAGMDAASYFFYKENRDRGLIFSLDADTVVDKNYINVVVDEFSGNNKLSGASIYYEHPLPVNKNIRDALVEYELHLRYYIHMLRRAGFPFAFHTIGSAFAVDYKAYLRQNGMPRKQGGEDFYFLNKVMLEGNYCDITATTVYPYGRPTKKTPFGTGVAIHSVISGRDKHFYTYHPGSFGLLSELVNASEFCYDFDCELFVETRSRCLREFLSSIKFCDKLRLIKSNTKDCTTFVKAYYTWFDGFKAVKMLNFVHSAGYYAKLPVAEAVEMVSGKKLTPLEFLYYFRREDKSNPLCLTSDFTVYEK